MKWKRKFVRGMGASDRVHGDDAGGDNIGIVDVGIGTPERCGNGFILKPCRVDESVAPKAAPVRRYGPADAEYISDVSRVVDRYLGADLGAGDAVLVHDRVEEQSGSHRVGREEDVVAIREMRRDVFMEEIVGNGFDAGAGIRSADVTGSQPNLVGPEPIRKFAGEPGRRRCVGAPSRDQAGEVREFRPVGIGEDEFAHAEPCKQFGENGAGATEADNSNPGAAQKVLAAVAKEAALTIIPMLGGCSRRRSGI